MQCHTSSHSLSPAHAGDGSLRRRIHNLALGVPTWVSTKYELVSIIVAAIVATVAAAGAVVAPAGIRRHILPRTVTVSTGRHVIISLAVPAIAIVGGDGDLR